MTRMDRETREQLHRLSIAEWKREHIAEVNALAASLARTNEALAALPAGHPTAADYLARGAAMLRADLGVAVNARNPFERGAS